MITYLEFINESVKNIKNPEFWNDVNLCFHEIVEKDKKRLVGGFIPFWDLCKKYPNILKKTETYDMILVNLHNKGKIKKNITFYEIMWLWFQEIIKTNELLTKRNQGIKNENFYDWFFNQEIDIYRGFPDLPWSLDKPKESLLKMETEFKSFSLDFDTSLRFTQYNWLSRGWVDDNKRNGWVIKSKTKPCDVHIYNMVAQEYECIIKSPPLTYTGYYIIKKAKIIKEVNY